MTCFPCHLRIRHAREGGYPNRFRTDELSGYHDFNLDEMKKTESAESLPEDNKKPPRPDTGLGGLFF